MTGKLQIFGATIGVGMIVVSLLLIIGIVWIALFYSDEFLTIYNPFPKGCQDCRLLSGGKMMCKPLPGHTVERGNLHYCKNNELIKIDDTNAWGDRRYCAYCTSDDDCFFGRKKDIIDFEPIYDYGGNLVGYDRIVVDTILITCRTFPAYSILDKNFNKAGSEEACSSDVSGGHYPFSRGVTYLSTGALVCDSSTDQQYRCGGDDNWVSTGQSCTVDPNNLITHSCSHFIDCEVAYHPKSQWMAGDVDCINGLCVLKGEPGDTTTTTTISGDQVQPPTTTGIFAMLDSILVSIGDWILNLFASFNFMSISGNTYDPGTSLTPSVTVTSPIEPDTDYSDGDVTYLYGKWLLYKDQEKINEGEWTQLSSTTYSPSITKTYNQAGRYAFVVVIASAKSTYDYETDTWSSWAISEVDKDAEAFTVGIPEPSEPSVGILDNIINTLVNWLTDLFNIFS